MLTSTVGVVAHWQPGFALLSRSVELHCSLAARGGTAHWQSEMALLTSSVGLLLSAVCECTALWQCGTALLFAGAGPYYSLIVHSLCTRGAEGACCV